MNMGLLIFLKQRWWIVLLIALLFILIILVLSIASNTATQPPQAQQVSPLQKVAVGTTTEDKIKQLPNFEKAVPLPSGNTEYQFTSPIVIRPNTVVAQTGIAVFERELTPQTPNATGYATISQYKAQFGQPEKDAQGSRFYDWVAHTYIYASRGFAFVGNPNTDEIFEFHFFPPTTADNYIKLYGEDINEGAQPEKLNPE